MTTHLIRMPASMPILPGTKITECDLAAEEAPNDQVVFDHADVDCVKCLRRKVDQLLVNDARD